MRVLYALSLIAALMPARASSVQQCGDWVNHVLLLSPSGSILDPCTLKSSREPIKLVNGIFDQLAKDRKTDTKLQILIFIQGGLTDPATACTAAQDPARMWALRHSHFFPIFIGWNSEVWSCLKESLVVIRGKKEDARNLYKSPLKLLGDIGSMVSKAPITIIQQFAETDVSDAFVRGSDFHSTRLAIHGPEEWTPEPLYLLDPEVSVINNEYNALIQQWASKGPASLDIRLGDNWYKRTSFEYDARKLSWLLTLPGKVALAPVVETGGLEAWQRMRGRIDNMFYPPYEFDLVDTLKKHPGAEKDPKVYEDAILPVDERLFDMSVFARLKRYSEKDEPPSIPELRGGGMYLFMTRLDEEAGADTEEPAVFLSAHSAGSILACEMLSRFPDIRYSTVEFMAAACELNDLHRSIIPYLSTHKTTHFYNVCLHPQHELDEWRLTRTYSGLGYDLVELCLERGSLLEWIDNFYCTPESFMNRTLGKYANIVEASYTIPRKVRKQVTVKAFAYDDSIPYLQKEAFDIDVYRKSADAGPQTHGEFAEWPFWEVWFYTNPGT